MRAFVLFKLFILYHIQNVSSNSVPKCITLKSYVSGVGDGDVAAQQCDNANYPTLVSCGYETKDVGDDQFEGSFINPNTLTAETCIAKNANNGAGVFAHARCCKFEQTVTCSAANGNDANGDDDLSTKQCNSAETMLGCSGFTWYEFFDGTFVGIHRPETVIAGSGTGPNNPYPMINHCNAQNGQDKKTRANINCCTTSGLGLDCNIYYAAPGKNNELECPAGKTMMSCNGQSNWMSANACYIENGVCKTRSTNSHSVYTSAVCCSEATLAPTPAPTSNPTQKPTDMPSTPPTSNTAAPTSPTAVPTTNPTRTRNPTAQPTDDTLSPSAAPSRWPTSDTKAPSTPPTAGTAHETTTVSVTDTTVTTPDEDQGGKDSNDQGEDDQGEDEQMTLMEKNETLFVMLFIALGLLFCFALIGGAYYCLKNRKQRNEIDYNNAHVAVAGGSENKAAADYDDDDVILDDINAISMEGTTATTTDGAATTGGTIVDASVGIKTTSGATMQTTSGGTTRQGATKGATQGLRLSPGATATATATASGTVGSAGNNDEDDQKSEVFKVSM